ncbi:MAG: hypothetical protein KatS3mg076_0450 [Candidatus Binatia bacterium]|nr:MAG: hypothetical protein KatS3mg076_0450 [Candidatus Binatia bacterium]
MSRPKEWAYAAVLGLLGVLFGFGLLEVGVRLARLEPDRFWEADPVLGARLVPGKKGWWTQEEREFLVWVEINDLGLRDVPRKLEKADGVFRILALGDSFLEALQVPLERAFTQVLERELSSRLGRPVEVINAGHSAYGTAGELLFFRERGVRFDPDLVLLAFYPGNDVLNNSPELEDVLVPVYDERGRPVRIHPRAGERREASPGGWLAWSKAYRYLRRMTLWARPELVEWLAGIGVVGERTAERVRKKARDR